MWLANAEINQRYSESAIALSNFKEGTRNNSPIDIKIQSPEKYDSFWPHLDNCGSSPKCTS